MQPVWILSVDLQTKTATFQSGLSDAAKAARGAFTDIKSGSNDMGRGVSGNMMEARHGVMLLGEEFGIHLPRALTSFIASIGPIGAAMEAAFPFLAIAVGATLLIEHLAKMHEAGEKLTEDQAHFGTAVQNAFNQLDSKLIQAQIKADELRNDHLGALKGELELIDRQSLDELVHSFEEVAKAADVVFKDLDVSWYQFGTGSRGAKHALDQFQTQYDALLAKGDDKGASGLLGGTLKQAQLVLAMQKQAKDNSGSLGEGSDKSGDILKFNAAMLELKKNSAGYDEKEIQAQQMLVDALNDQLTIEGKVTALKNQDKHNATTTTGNAAAAQAAAAQKQAAETQLRMGELSVAADRAIAQERLAVSRASIEERLQSDLDFAAREYQLKVTANQAEMAALDKSGKDYANQLKAAQDKALELTREYATQQTEIKAKAGIASNALELANLEQSEREKIEVTDRASAERLAAIDSAIKQEQAKGLQDTNFYRELLNRRIQEQQQMTDETAKLTAEAGKEEADSEQKMGELKLAGQLQHQAAIDSARRMSDQQRIVEATAAAEAEYQLKVKGFAQDEAALNKSGKDYANQLKALQDKEKQAEQEHANEIAAIKEKAEIASNARILAGWQQFSGQMASGLTQVLMRHENFAKMISSLGNEVVSSMIKNSLMIMLQQDKERFSTARLAAVTAFNKGEHMGGPAGIVLGPVFGAAAFAAAMAFEGGGIVPGVGRGDVVSAMLTPGEAVLPKGLTERLNKAAGSDMGGTHYHTHVRPTYHVQVLDGDGLQTVLDKHTTVLQKHFENSVRKMNR